MSFVELNTGRRAHSYGDIPEYIKFNREANVAVSVWFRLVQTCKGMFSVRHERTTMAVSLTSILSPFH